MRKLLLLLSISSIVALGCGGGGGGNSSGGPGGNDLNVDPFFGSGSLVGDVAVTNSSNWGAIGFGGSFTDLRVQANAVSPNSLMFVGAFRDDQFRLASFGGGGTDLQYIGSNYNARHPTVSLDGRKVVFEDLIANGVTRLKLINTNGSGLKTLTTPPTGYEDVFPTYSTVGDTVLFVRETVNPKDYAELRLLNPTTGLVGPAFYKSNSPIVRPHFSLDGASIYFVSYMGTDKVSAYRVSAKGGVATKVYAGMDTDDVWEVTESPNHDGLIVLVKNNQTGKYVLIQTDRFDERLLAEESDSPFYLMEVPNSPYLAYQVWGNLVTIRLLNVVTGQTQDIWQTPHATLGVDLVPPQKVRSVVGGAGLFGSTLNGLIASRREAEVGTLVGFNATTPSTVQVSALTGDNTTGPNLDFKVVADSITYLGYLNEDMLSPATAVGMDPVTAHGAFVSLSALTGKLTVLIPYTESRGASRYTREGSDSVFEGQLLGVYTSDGKNLAKSGASKVRVRGNGSVTIEGL